MYIILVNQLEKLRRDVVSTNDKVSIIMPAYNSEKFIKSAINSVIKQTYENWELLIIDDGSGDKTLNIIEKFSNNESRIKSIPNKSNNGVSDSRNKGIKLAKGEWIAFLDSDDIWHPKKLKMQLETARLKSADFIYTGVTYINEKDEFYNGTFSVPEKVNYSKLLKQNFISCSSVLIKKEKFNQIKMENDDIHEDYAVWLRLLKTGGFAYAVNKPLLIYRISKSSKSGNKFKTFRMTYNVFRFIKINPLVSIYYTFSHILGSIIKYSKILIPIKTCKFQV